jgi:hypothetical protein
MGTSVRHCCDVDSYVIVRKCADNMASDAIHRIDHV